MSTITFDTLGFSKSLRQAGFSQDQAEAMTHAQSKALQEMVNAQELVTKKDLHIALGATKHDLELKIAEAKHELIKWIVGALLAQSALIVGIIAFMK